MRIDFRFNLLSELFFAYYLTIIFIAVINLSLLIFNLHTMLLLKVLSKKNELSSAHQGP